MKNLHKVAMSLVAGILAIGFSAFTNAPHHSSFRANKAVRAGMITDNYIVQPTLNNFTPSSTTPNVTLCSGTATLQCAYSVTSSGKTNIPDQSSYTSTEINTYSANGWIVPMQNSKLALYQQ